MCKYMGVCIARNVENETDAMIPGENELSIDQALKSHMRTALKWKLGQIRAGSEPESISTW